jgi:hypothetical protein
MYGVQCPRTDKVEMLPLSRLVKVVNTDKGILVEVDCRCGEHHVAVTGRSAGPDRTLPTPAAA